MPSSSFVLCSALAGAIAFAPGLTATASAQAGDTPVPQACPDCARAGAEAASIRERINQRNEDLRRLRNEQRINDTNIRNLRQMRVDAVRDNDQAAARQYEQSIDDLQGDNTAIREQQFKVEQEIRSLNQQLEKTGRAVDDCAKRCGMQFRWLPTGVVNSADQEPATDSTPATSGVAVPPVRTPAQCDDCKERVTELENEHRQLQRLAAEANARGQAADLRPFEEQRRKVRSLQRQVDDCARQCRPRTAPRTTSFKDPRVIGGVAGGAALIAVLAGGGSNDVSAAPSVSPVPVASAPQPPPTSQPQPPPQDPFLGLAGVHDCLACASTSDPMRHDLVIRLCDLAGGPWDVTIGSISIGHAAPFVSTARMTIDAAGNFRDTLRGTVAGIPNVGIEIAGTADPATGRVRFTYTMGTGGELPGRAAISYEITLQKRR